MSDTELFPVTVEWMGEKLTHARTPAGLELDIATPPVFQGGMHGYWSPEDLLPAASASCLILTLVSACRARELPLHALGVRSVGEIGKRDDGRYGFRRLDVELHAATDEASAEQLARLAQHVERSCIVSTALGIPVGFTAQVNAGDAAA